MKSRKKVVVVPPRTPGDNYRSNMSRRPTSPTSSVKSHADHTDRRRIEGCNFINSGPVPLVSSRKHDL